jgi:hypothetical protein
MRLNKFYKTHPTWHILMLFIIALLCCFAISNNLYGESLSFYDEYKTTYAQNINNDAKNIVSNDNSAETTPKRKNALSSNQRDKIISLLEKKIENKLKHYKRETSYMPFLSRLMQDNEKVVEYSFMHSMTITLGMSIYEEVSRIIAEETAQECFTQYKVKGLISIEQTSVINEIIRKLRNRVRVVNHDKEVELVLSASAENGKQQNQGSTADFYMLRDGVEYYFEIKGAKPDIATFTINKTKLLEWVARRKKPIRAYIALPYNPYHPEPFIRFSEQGVLERGKDILVGKEYWDFIGGEGTYEELLEIFELVGKKYKDKIHQKTQEIAEEK